jgi:hypothetical protein
MELDLDRETDRQRHTGRGTQTGRGRQADASREVWSNWTWTERQAETDKHRQGRPNGRKTARSVDTVLKPSLGRLLS